MKPEKPRRLNDVLADLDSTKVADRTKALTSLEEYFANDSHVEKFDKDHDSRAWIILFQKVFTSIQREKEDYLKKLATGKGETVPADRLLKLSHFLQDLVARCVHLLNSKGVKHLYDRLLKDIKHHGKLLAPLAQNYIKTLRCILSWRAHMDHIKRERWIQLVTLAFNVVLNEPLGKSLKPDEAEEMSVDSDMYMDDEENSDGESTPGPSRKRRRGVSTPSRPKAKAAVRQPHNSHKAPSLEQREFMGLLVTLFQSNATPLLSPQDDEFDFDLPSAVLRRFDRFLHVYSTDSTLRPDYLKALAAALSHLALNRRQCTEQFAATAWSGLVAMWDAKDRSIKEILVGVLKVLLPYLTSSDRQRERSHVAADGIRKLWNLVDAEAANRFGVDGLSLDCLRLDLRPVEEERGAFVASTFGYGWHFDATQVLAWALLELQADCTAELFLESQSAHPGTPSTMRADGKRIKLENPVLTLLHTMQAQFAPNVRVYRLQVLLFLIERHWDILRDELQESVLTSLVQLLSSSDDPQVQSFILLCLAAIAHTDSERDCSTRAATWDPILTQAIRRMNVPGVCRAAAHLAGTLLAHAPALLTRSRMLAEVAACARDLDVQGPAATHDSVCAFLARALRVARGDVRLCRMRLEEQALGWLLERWKPTGRARMQPCGMGDIVGLLESACVLPRGSEMAGKMLLPDCPLVTVLSEERRTAVIRDFVLHAKLPPFQAAAGDSAAARMAMPVHSTGVLDGELAQPGSRERKVSAFLLRSLETIAPEWEGDTFAATAEHARNVLDFAVTGLIYETLLAFNGTRVNRRVLQAACKLIGTIVPLILGSRWTIEEKALVMLGLEPLVVAGDEYDDERGWDAMVMPEAGSGIKREVLNSLLRHSGATAARVRATRRDFQRTLWQSADIQDAFVSVLSTMKMFIRVLLKDSSKAGGRVVQQGVDEDDEFSSRPTNAAIDSSQGAKVLSTAYSVCVQVCMSFLAIAPILQCSSGEPTRDKDLTDIVMGVPIQQFLLVAPPFVDNVGLGILNISPAGIDRFLDKLGDHLEGYEYSRNERLLALTIRFLEATLRIWVNPAIAAGDLGVKIKMLYDALTPLNKIRSWAVRDRLVRFLNKYLAVDPAHQALEAPGLEYGPPESAPALPAALLPMMGNDEDIRVRFRLAVVNAQLFPLSLRIGADQEDLYPLVRDSMSRDPTSFDGIVTRIICLANITILSSAFRPGSYWLLLEICLNRSACSVDYGGHVQSVLLGISQRLGLSNFSELFRIHARQIAFNVRKYKYDFMTIPPHLLGFRDRKQCAEASFEAFSLTYIVDEAKDEGDATHGDATYGDATHGDRPFVNHCKAVGRTPADGIRQHFSTLVGCQIATCPSSAKLEGLLRAKTAHLGDPVRFDELLRHQADGIIVAILRTLGDQDITPNGPICQALGQVGESSVACFQALVRHRSLADFYVHQPHTPHFPTKTVLWSLEWFIGRDPAANSAAVSYHVLHQLFADIHRSPLVNEQMRIINAMSLWIACQCNHFQELALLRTLINGATSILAQPELSHAAQSLLEWSFAQEITLLERYSRLPEILVQICCTAYDFSRNTDPQIRGLGKELQKWVDAQTLVLCESKDLRQLIAQKALPAWPCEPSPALARIGDDIGFQSLSKVLGDSRITSNKFRIVRRLRHVAASQGSFGEQFSKVDFWRLKDCIPPTEELQDDDIDAFVSLLLTHQGTIGTCSDQVNTSNLLARHCKEFKKKETAADANTFPQRPIIQTLLLSVDTATGSEVHAAYHTLRLLMSGPLKEKEQEELKTWSPEYRRELKCLQRYRRPSEARPRRSIAELASFDLATADYNAWIIDLTVLLSDILSSEQAFYTPISTMLLSNPSFADEMLPILVHTILQMEITGSRDAASARDIISSFFTSLLHASMSNLACVNAVVKTVLHLRNFTPPNTKDALARDKWLAIDFLLLSRSAIKGSSYTTALLFLELAAEYDAEACSAESMPEDILFEIYSHIEEPDGFYGIKTSNLRQFLVKRLHHEKQWDKAFQLHGAAVEAGSSESDEARGVFKALHSFGFNHLAMSTWTGASAASSSEMSDAPVNLSYSVGWRTETWDLPEDVTDTDSGASLYMALKAIHRDRDEKSINTIVRRSQLQEMNRLRSLGDENLAEIRETVQSLMCLNQITQWRSESVNGSIRSQVMDPARWKHFCTTDPNFRFPDLEAIMATRVSLVRAVRRKEQREQIGDLVSSFTEALLDIEKKCLLNLSASARQTSSLQISLNSVIAAQRLEKVETLATSQELADVLWLQKEQKIAIEMLQRMLGAVDQNSLASEPTMAILRARLGEWVAEACLEKPVDIVTKYFGPAVAELSSHQQLSSAQQKTSAVVYRQYAVFAERQYHSILRSPDLIRRKLYADRKHQEIQSRGVHIKNVQSGTREHNELWREQKKAIALLAEDEAACSVQTTALNAFLQQAISMFAFCLEACNLYDDDSAIRLSSLWFANFDSPDIQETVRTALDKCPSGKFVFLAHQLAARLATPFEEASGNSQESLRSLLMRMCREHPFHTLYPVYHLRAEHTNSQPTPSMSSSSRRRSVRQDPPASQVGRAAAADDIFNRLREEEETTRKRVNDVELLLGASLEWAKLPIKGDKRFDNKRKGPFEIPKTARIVTLRDLEVPVITAHTPVDPTMQYKDCIRVAYYDPSFSTAGGINLPKISTCWGINGEPYKQLFKGEGDDDLRQDAVMEQVFDLVNVVLQRDRATRDRGLSIRSYKVIPLAAQAGLLEFVSDTQPLQTWLAAAHNKYHPEDLKYLDIGRQLTELRRKTNGRPDQEQQLQALFVQLRTRFKPVLRHLWTEKHKVPMSWFSMRLNYTRSVAVSSMVGHILGLGDRHTSNILIHNITGEVIHIDLGIAFEQGRFLPIAERVPFRMTADIIDGMGMSGTQGVFQRCAEETLRVLRDGSEVILEVLEVFRHDPLHSWTASDVKVKRAQEGSVQMDTYRHVVGIDMSSDVVDEAADRALSTIKRKFDKSLSVEYTVNELLAEATDTMNLANMFHGWGAIL